MQKYEKMVQISREKSNEMTEIALEEIENMYRKNIKISVVELTKQTGFSRGFFYNNEKVKQAMMDLKKKQQGMILKNSKSDAIAKAQEARIKKLEDQLSASVSIEEYNELMQKYKKLESENKKIKSKKICSIYDKL